MSFFHEKLLQNYKIKNWCKYIIPYNNIIFKALNSDLEGNKTDW